MAAVSKIIGFNLKRLRDDQGQTQQFVAEATDLSLRAFQSIESGAGNPTIKTIEILAKHFMVSVDSLCRLSRIGVADTDDFKTNVARHFEKADYGVLIRDLNGVIAWLNPRAERLTGFQQAHVPIDLFQLLTGPAREMLRVNLETQKRGEAMPMINYLTNENGDNVFFRLQPSLVYAGTSRVPEFAVVFVYGACDCCESFFHDFCYDLLRLGKLR